MANRQILRHKVVDQFVVKNGRCGLCDDKQTKCIIASNLATTIGEKAFVDVRFDLENNQIDAQFGLLNEDGSASVNSDWSSSLNINYCPICGKKLPSIM